METDIDSLRELVQLYENNRALWDSKHSDYYNKSKREDAWRQISQQVNIPVEDLKRKIQSLTGSFRREKSRIKKRGDDTYTSKWFGYTWFQFLSDKDIPKDSISQDEYFVPAPNEIENQYGSASPTHSRSIPSNSQTFAGTNLDVNETPSTSSYNSANFLRTKRSLKRRAATINEDIAIEDPYTVPLKKSHDHYYSFGNYISSELRKYDPQIVPFVKKAILDVLFQADIGQFQQHPRRYNATGYNSSNASTPLSSSEQQPTLNNQSIKVEFVPDANLDDGNSSDPFALNRFPNNNPETSS